MEGMGSACSQLINMINSREAAATLRRITQCPTGMGVKQLSQLILLKKAINNQCRSSYNNK
jgi:hypothetical protein